MLVLTTSICNVCFVLIKNCFVVAASYPFFGTMGVLPIFQSLG